MFPGFGFCLIVCVWVVIYLFHLNKLKHPIFLALLWEHNFRIFRVEDCRQLLLHDVLYKMEDIFHPLLY